MAGIFCPFSSLLYQEAKIVSGTWGFSNRKGEVGSGELRVIIYLPMFFFFLFLKKNLEDFHKPQAT